MTTLTGPGIGTAADDSNWTAPVAAATLTAHMPAMPRLVEPAPEPDPAETTLCMDDLTRPAGYVGRHSDPRQADWKPAHTRAAARRRARIRHARADGVRPDLRIEQTEGLSIEQINEMLAGGER